MTIDDNTFKGSDIKAIITIIITIIITTRIVITIAIRWPSLKRWPWAPSNDQHS